MPCLRFHRHFQVQSKIGRRESLPSAATNCFQATRQARPQLRELIRRMTRENFLWGQRRIQAELARVGFWVCARTVAKYMRRPYNGSPSPGWRQFLTQHSDEIWACDLFTVRTVWFQTLYVFLSFITALANWYMRGLLHTPIQRGWRNKWSKPAGYREKHRVT